MSCLPPIHTLADIDAAIAACSGVARWEPLAILGALTLLIPLALVCLVIAAATWRSR